MVSSSCRRNHVAILKHSNYVFDNGGYTVFFLLKESHLSIHYYVEYRSAFIDVFTCGNADANSILHDIELFYSPRRVETKEIHRGRPSHA